MQMAGKRAEHGSKFGKAFRSNKPHALAPGKTGSHALRAAGKAGGRAGGRAGGKKGGGGPKSG